MTKSFQSTEAAPEPAEPTKFDTTTPAQPTPIRRFSLNDLPRYEASLYPHLKKIFPHLHERMYGGWLRACIQDNSCFFVCGNATVAMAQIDHDPFDPRPFIQIVFMLGDVNEYKPLMDEIMNWKTNIGAFECRHWLDNHAGFAKLIKRPYETRTSMIFT